MKVLEAYTRDVGQGKARIDYPTMDELLVNTGGILLLKNGVRETVAKALPLYPSDERKGIIRIDGLIRNNCGTAIGSDIELSKCTDVAPATEVFVRPLEEIPPIDERYLADALEGTPIHIDDNVFVPYFGGRLTFQVYLFQPAKKAVIIQQNTIFHMTAKVKPDISISSWEGKVPKEFIEICSTYRQDIDEIKDKLSYLVGRVKK